MRPVVMGVDRIMTPGLTLRRHERPLAERRLPVDSTRPQRPSRTAGRALSSLQTSLGTGSPGDRTTSEKGSARRNRTGGRPVVMSVDRIMAPGLTLSRHERPLAERRLRVDTNFQQRPSHPVGRTLLRLQPRPVGCEQAHADRSGSVGTEPVEPGTQPPGAWLDTPVGRIMTPGLTLSRHERPLAERRLPADTRRGRRPSRTAGRAPSSYGA
ncbi:hypothetical protein GCM10022197_31000 [Microlunatus spumicola]|uniref:Uncharacterized protein n=1 Tax=Microlunatus spumicola TaxID=81499 RepID=A0ABP6XUA0_9ACTN